jgi:D-2-hydroxyglutarate dehydrogenase
VSTNAGGLRLLRYGSLHGSVLGVEAVLPDGRVLDLLRTLRKDNTGLDLKQLFIGAEGALGVVTAVALLAPPRPTAVHVAFLALPDFGAVLAATARARTMLGEVLSAVEFVDRESLELCLEQLDGVRDPLPQTRGRHYLVVETSGSVAAHDREKLESYLEAALGAGEVLDGTVAGDSAQARALWRLREGVTEALVKAGAVYKYDLCMPQVRWLRCMTITRTQYSHPSLTAQHALASAAQARMYELVEQMRNLFPLPARVVGYGHVGDGNLHLNVSVPKADAAVLARIEPFVYQWTRDARGSISAEHGLGLMKAGAVGYSKSPDAIQLMRQIKQMMDPNGAAKARGWQRGMA